MDSIYGINISFISSESDEHTENVIKLVKEKLNEHVNDGQNTPLPKAALMSCMSLSDEILKLRKEKNNLESALAVEKQRADEAVLKRAETETECARLKQEVLNLKIELSNDKG